MAREFAKGFYSSKRWQDCRNAYAAERGHLCERCLRSGLYSPGVIVHHKIELTPANINNPDITLNYNNLELLCRACHAEQHPDPWEKVNERKRERKDARNRYKVDAYGKVTAR